MSIQLETLVVVISSGACFVLCYCWLKTSKQKIEPIIAMIGATVSLVLYFLNDYKDKKQTGELVLHKG